MDGTPPPRRGALVAALGAAVVASALMATGVAYAAATASVDPPAVGAPVLGGPAPALVTIAVPRTTDCPDGALRVLPAGS